MSVDHTTAYLDAVERCWARDGDLGVTVREVERAAKDGSPEVGTWPGIVPARWCGKSGLLDAVFGRAVAEVWAWMATAIVCADTTGQVAALEWLSKELRDRPFLARLLATGIGPERRESDDLMQARVRLWRVAGSAAGVEAFHGLVAGEIAGRWCPTDDERRAALRAVLAMADVREEAADA